jgi:predicted RNA-binding Zn-ribbon protein involved in translation (DUF1610 family)
VHQISYEKMITAAKHTIIGQHTLFPLKRPTTPALSRNQLSRLEQLATAAPWQKLEVLLQSNSETIENPFSHPILLMKLLVLQEFFDINIQQLRSRLGTQYSLFVLFVPGLEHEMPSLTEIARLKRCLQKMNVLYAFFNECVEVLGLDRSKIDLYPYYNEDSDTDKMLIATFPASQALHSLACPRCSRKNLRRRKQSLVLKIFSTKKAYTCNSCAFHFDL